MVHARSLGVAELAALFREGFSDYSVPLALSEAAFVEHLSQNDIDLECSRVAVVDRPASLALIGRRGDQAWIGGMATAPAYRRQGLGRQALVAAIDAVAALGCQAVWLEVLMENVGAIALYERLGFEHVRELIVWTLEAPGSSASRQAKPDLAHRWIREHHSVREPWQRAQPTLSQCEALIVERDGEVAGAALYRDRGDARVIIQAAAIDDEAARQTLLVTSGTVRFANVDSSDPFSRAFEALSGRREARQFELRRSLPR